MNNVVQKASVTVDPATGRTTFTPGRWDASVMKLNTSQWRIRANIRNSIRRQLPQVTTYQPNWDPVAIVGGGWSLTDTLPELLDLHFRGTKIVALNNAANWLMDRNIRPSMVVMLDSRPENAYMLDRDIPNCKYMLASQCHPDLFDKCTGRDTTVFHVCSTDSEHERNRLDAYYNKRWVNVPSAGTVGVVAVMLARVLGFQRMHLFGYDSCYDPVTLAHHAYDQPLNDQEGHATFRVGDRLFECSAWQASQVDNFVDMIKVNGNLFQLAVHGDGVLSHIMRSGSMAFERAHEAQAPAHPGDAVIEVPTARMGMRTT